MNTIMHRVHVFGYFLMRDFYVFRTSWRRILINFGTIVPITMTIAFGYFLPNSNMINPTPVQTTTFFVGCILWSMFPLAFLLNLDLLFDLEHDRFIDYQMITLDPPLILLQKIVFSTVITFLSVVLFYPIANILLGSYFYAAALSWPALILVLLLGSLFCAAFNMFMVCFIESTQKIGNFWMRFNNPMITLGGLFIPWSVMVKYSTLLGAVSLFNPLLYITEGIRTAIIGGDKFFSLPSVVAALLFFSILCYFLACYFFKKKVDYV
jgi:ABC-type transport system involved in cytochrome c biogenesis permease component